jgi:predicted Ser/Thr protein kinase
MSNCRDLNPSDISLAPFPNIPLDAETFKLLSKDIEADYTKKSRMIHMHNRLTGLVEVQSVTPARSKEFLDRIDLLLAKYFEFSEEELDYIISYDIKYRIADDGEAENQ